MQMKQGNEPTSLIFSRPSTLYSGFLKMSLMIHTLSIQREMVGADGISVRHMISLGPPRVFLSIEYSEVLYQFLLMVVWGPLPASTMGMGGPCPRRHNGPLATMSVAKGSNLLRYTNLKYIQQDIKDTI